MDGQERKLTCFASEFYIQSHKKVIGIHEPGMYVDK